MLIQSKFPVNDAKEGGLTPLILIARDDCKEAINVAIQLIHSGCDINQHGQMGQTALSQAISHDNKKFTEILLKKEAKIFNEELSLRDVSPFFVAINK